MSAPTRPRPALGWQAYLAATVLALLAAGAVLWFAAGDDSAEVEGTRLTLRDADEIPEGGPTEVPVTDLDGETETIGDMLDGRPMVVNFFQSYCPPCIAEMPAFETVSQELAGEVDFLGIAVQDRPEDARRIVEQTRITYPWWRDIQGDLIATTRSTVMPTTMLVTADGEVAELHAGALTAGELRELIGEHLP